MLRDSKQLFGSLASYTDCLYYRSNFHYTKSFLACRLLSLSFSWLFYLDCLVVTKLACSRFRQYIIIKCHLLVVARLSWNPSCSAPLTHPLQVCPNHPLMFFIQVISGLPRPLFPSILSSSNNFWIDLALITCPKYGHFLFFIVGNNELVVFAIFKNSSLVLLSVHDTIKIVRFPPRTI